MAFPINSAATAVALTLPFTVTDTFGGVAFGVTWYKYTNSGASATMIGARLVAATNPFVEVFVDAGVTPAVPQFLNTGNGIQVPVPAGQTRWFALNGTANGNLSIEFSVQPAPTQIPGAGDIVVIDVSQSAIFPAVILNFTDEEVIAINTNLPNGDRCDQSPTGIICIGILEVGGNIDEIGLYSSNPLGQEILTIANPYAPAGIQIRSDYVGYFYFALLTGGQFTVRRLSYAGALDATVWDTALAVTLFAFSVNVGGTKAYYSANDAGAIHAYDIAGDAPLADFVAAVAGRQVIYLRTLADDSVLATYKITANDNLEVRRYNAAGVLQGTWVVPTDQGFVATTSQIPGDNTQFVARTEDDALNNSTFWKITVATMVASDSFGPLSNFDDGESAEDTPNYFGPSEATDLLVLLLASEPLSGIYEMVIDKRNDSLYLTYSPVTTEDHAIPDPHFITGFVEDE